MPCNFFPVIEWSRRIMHANQNSRRFRWHLACNWSFKPDPKKMWHHSRPVWLYLHNLTPKQKVKILCLRMWSALATCVKWSRNYTSNHSHAWSWSQHGHSPLFQRTIEHGDESGVMRFTDELEDDMKYFNAVKS